jgi:hypothetical protein
MRSLTLPSERCPGCGAPAEPDSCDELFQVLLALDHSRQDPWGPLHGVSVSCFLLQHHGGSVEGVSPRRAVLQAYLDGGLEAVEHLTTRARRANRRGGVVFDLDPAHKDALPVGPFAVTIVDVAHGGKFPADGFAERVRNWASAIQS